MRKEKEKKIKNGSSGIHLDTIFDTLDIVRKIFDQIILTIPFNTTKQNYN
jgi:hypothetical protein